ncbi:MAG: DUF494 domain-containing protein [Ignavibacteria bacterium]|nr:DUF494 domain-containing protein [Ignavibacteria bacterium]
MERLLEIIIYFANELSKKKQIDEFDIKLLLNKGYTKSEISVALSWIFEKLEEGKSTLFQNLTAENKSFRYLHISEKELFTREGWQELNNLYSLGIISLEILELFIDRAMMLGLRNIDDLQVKKFISSLLFGSSQGFLGQSNNDIIN